jgi:hypothetical protein
MKFKLLKQFNIENSIFLCLFIVGLYLSTVRVMGLDFANIPGDLADSRLNNYFLEHAHLFFSGKISHYWSAPFMYPEKEIITFSDNLLGTFPIYSFFRVIGYDRESAYQGWIIILFALNFLSAGYVLKKITGSIGIAAIGAYIFAFSLPITSLQIYHSQVFPRFIVPFVFYWLFNFFKTQQIKYFAGVVFGIVFQFYAGIYLGFLLTICILVYILIRIAFIKEFIKWIKQLGWSKTIKIIGISLLGVLILIPLFYPYYQRSLAGVRMFDEVKNSIPYLSSYLFVGSGTLFWGFLTSTAMDLPYWWDHLLFPGGLVIIGFVLFPFLAYKNRKTLFIKEAVYIYITLLIVLVLTLQYKDFTLYKIIYLLPGFSSLRAIGRIINIELFLFSSIVCFTLFFLYSKTKYKQVFLIVISVFCVLDQFMSADKIMTFNKKNSQRRIANVETKLINNNYKNYTCFAFIPDSQVELPMYTHIDAMFASQHLNIPTMNGYTAASPFEYGPFGLYHDALSLHRWLKINNMDIWKNKILLIK